MIKGISSANFWALGRPYGFAKGLRPSKDEVVTTIRDECFAWTNSDTILDVLERYYGCKEIPASFRLNNNLLEFLYDQNIQKGIGIGPRGLHSLSRTLIFLCYIIRGATQKYRDSATWVQTFI